MDIPRCNGSLLSEGIKMNKETKEFWLSTICIVFTFLILPIIAGVLGYYFVFNGMPINELGQEIRLLGSIGCGVVVEIIILAMVRSL
jgi:hypothetical protein